MSDTLKNSIFVFGSNEAGRHGAGAAYFAMKHRGAIYGKGIGLMGTSYALPTKGEAPNKSLFTLDLSKIKEYVDQFLMFAQERKDLRFQVTRIGCGLAGLKDSEIAPMFAEAPNNVMLPGVWKAILDQNFRMLAVLSPIGHIPPGEHIVMYQGDIRVPKGAYKSTTVDHNDFENLAWYASHYAPTNDKRVQKMMEDRGVVCYTGPTIVCDKGNGPC